MNRSEPEAKDAPSLDAYAAFAPLFERLSTPLVTVLKGLLEQFEALVEEVSALQSAPRGQVEGLGGIGRRGEIDRAAPSELLLRTEAPLEFLRRLVEGETIYHETLYADPGRRPVFRALVSVGPGALGHGRFVSLAALFFLARLAAVRNADFYWCFLPRTEGPVWFDDLSLNNVKRLLRAASHREPSSEEVTKAGALWDELFAQASQPSAVRLDWVIGARQHLAAGHDDASHGANGLVFTMAPPSGDQARTVELGLKRLGRERRRAQLTLPDDTVCVGALRNPFRPPRPQAATPELAARAQEPRGWAPRYLVNAATDQKLLRLADGLLLLQFDDDLQVAQSLFIPLDKTVRLAGIRLYREGFMLVVQTGDGSAGQLTLGSYQLDRKGPPRLTFRRLTKAPSAHLFAQQPPYALPSLTHTAGVRIYSSSGMAYQLVFGAGETMTFEPLYKGPNIIGSNGVHEILRIQGREKGRIEVVRPTGHPLRSFEEGAQPLQPPALRALVYSHSTSSLAYSLTPNRWRFAGFKDGIRDGEDQLVLAPHEVLLSGQARDTVINVRLWSDARRGGDGEVRGVRVIRGERTTTGAVLKLGRTALDTVAVRIGDDGVVWIVSTNKAGEPGTLTAYRKHKSGGGYTPTHYNLDRLRQKARCLDMDSLHG